METVRDVKTKPQTNTKVKRMYASTEMSILLYVLEMRYMNLAQIKCKFFQENREPQGTKAFSIIKRLLEEGLLVTKDQTLGQDTLFKVSEAGLELIKTVHQERKLPALQRGIMPMRVNHDLKLTDLRIRFEELKYIVRWGSEGALREVPIFLREFADMPDALCKKPNGKSYFLELEVVMKAPKQYREKIDNYLRILDLEDFKSQEVEGVIFFCTDEKVAAKIKEQIPAGAKGISVQLYAKYFAERKARVLPMVSKSTLARAVGN